MRRTRPMMRSTGDGDRRQRGKSLEELCLSCVTQSRSHHRTPHTHPQVEYHNEQYCTFSMKPNWQQSAIAHHVSRYSGDFDISRWLAYICESSTTRSTLWYTQACGSLPHKIQSCTSSRDFNNTALKLIPGESGRAYLSLIQYPLAEHVYCKYIYYTASVQPRR